MTDYPQLWRPTGKGHSSLLVKGKSVLAYVSPGKVGGEEGKVRKVEATGSCRLQGYCMGVGSDGGGSW